MRIAFHAPMKPPDDPVPSGDRNMARALLAALVACGHEVEVVSRLRTHLPMPDADAMRAIEAAADREAERIAAGWEAGPRPDLWFTYHAYYRAPDLLGARLAQRFGLPYGLAEASHADKRGKGPWAPWHAANARAIRDAAFHICFTPRDAAGLQGLVAPDRVTMLPPFVMTDPPGRLPHRSTPGPVRLATVAMMRPGGKARSYAFLAAALAALPADADWHLSIAGDGLARADVERRFAALPAGRITWHGVLPPEDVATLLRQADLYVWPGIGEAFGVCYLEAQAAGLAVLAMECGGIASVVANGRTGLLTPEGDLHGYAAALAGLIADEDLRMRLGREGRRMVLEERTVTRAAAILSSAIDRARSVPA